MDETTLSLKEEEKKGGGCSRDRQGRGDKACPHQPVLVAKMKTISILSLTEKGKGGQGAEGFP